MDKATLEYVVQMAVEKARFGWDHQHEAGLLSQGITQKLDLDIKGDKLKPLLAKRAEHHRARMKFYQDEIKAFNEKHASSQDAPGRSFSNTSSGSGDPTVDWLNSVREHHRKAGWFQVMSENLRGELTYRLSEAWVGMLELAEATAPSE